MREMIREDDVTQGKRGWGEGERAVVRQQLMAMMMMMMTIMMTIMMMTTTTAVLVVLYLDSSLTRLHHLPLHHQERLPHAE